MRISIAFMAALAALCASASQPIDFVTAVRNPSGQAVADKLVEFSVDIVGSPTSTEPLYSETHRVTTDERGMARLLIGEGDAMGGSFEDLTWDQPLYLTLAVDVNNSGVYRPMGTVSLLGAPLAEHAVTATELTRHSPSGKLWSLQVDNNGRLSWKEIQQVSIPTPDLGCKYDEAKIPEKLYFIGTFNKWTIAEAVEFTKIDRYNFTIERELTAGEIFKFTPTQTWANAQDWSTETMGLNKALPMREAQNCPAFPGPDGTYELHVDFYNYTLTITPK